MQYEIEFIPLAIKLLKKIQDQREQKALRQKIEKLKIEINYKRSFAPVS